MLGFGAIKYWKYCKHSHIFPMKHPDQPIKRQSDQVICFIKLNHDQVPAMVRFYFSPPPLVYPYYSVLSLLVKAYPFLQIVNDDCATCCTARKNTLSHLFFLHASARVHVAVDNPQAPGFQRIGTTLRTDAKRTSKIPPRRPFV